MYAHGFIKNFVSAGLVLLFAVPCVAEERWGNVKGRITWDGRALPKERDEEFVVDSRNKGVKNVFVWLVNASDPKNPKSLPINPAIKTAREITITIQAPPLGRLEPRALALEKGQLLAIKNDAAVAESIITEGADKDNPCTVTRVPAGEVTRIALSASRVPIIIESTTDPKKKAYARVFDHPYFAVTGVDGKYFIKGAPSGKYNIVMWHEGAGWVNGGKLGNTIEIRSGKDTEVDEKLAPAESEKRE